MSPLPKRSGGEGRELIDALATELNVSRREVTNLKRKMAQERQDNESRLQFIMQEQRAREEATQEQLVEMDSLCSLLEAGAIAPLQARCLELESKCTRGEKAMEGMQRGLKMLVDGRKQTSMLLGLGDAWKENGHGDDHRDREGTAHESDLDLERQAHREDLVDLVVERSAHADVLKVVEEELREAREMYDQDVRSMATKVSPADVPDRVKMYLSTPPHAAVETKLQSGRREEQCRASTSKATASQYDIEKLNWALSLLMSKDGKVPPPPSSINGTTEEVSSKEEEEEENLKKMEWALRLMMRQEAGMVATGEEQSGMSDEQQRHSVQLLELNRLLRQMLHSKKKKDRDDMGGDGHANKTMPHSSGSTDLGVRRTTADDMIWYQFDKNAEDSNSGNDVITTLTPTQSRRQPTFVERGVQATPPCEIGVQIDSEEINRAMGYFHTPPPSSSRVEGRGGRGGESPSPFPPAQALNMDNVVDVLRSAMSEIIASSSAQESKRERDVPSSQPCAPITEKQNKEATHSPSASRLPEGAASLSGPRREEEEEEGAASGLPSFLADIDSGSETDSDEEEIPPPLPEEEDEEEEEEEEEEAEKNTSTSHLSPLLRASDATDTILVHRETRRPTFGQALPGMTNKEEVLNLLAEHARRNSVTLQKTASSSSPSPPLSLDTLSGSTEKEEKEKKEEEVAAPNGGSGSGGSFSPLADLIIEGRRRLSSVSANSAKRSMRASMKLPSPPPKISEEEELGGEEREEEKEEEEEEEEKLVVEEEKVGNIAELPERSDKSSPLAQLLIEGKRRLSSVSPQSSPTNMASSSSSSSFSPDTELGGTGTTPPSAKSPSSSLAEQLKESKRRLSSPVDNSTRRKPSYNGIKEEEEGIEGSKSPSFIESKRRLSRNEGLLHKEEEEEPSAIEDVSRVSTRSDSSLDQVSATRDVQPQASPSPPSLAAQLVASKRRLSKPSSSSSSVPAAIVAEVVVDTPPSHFHAKQQEADSKRQISSHSVVSAMTTTTTPPPPSGAVRKRVLGASLKSHSTTTTAETRPEEKEKEEAPKPASAHVTVPSVTADANATLPTRKSSLSRESALGPPPKRKLGSSSRAMMSRLK